MDETIVIFIIAVLFVVVLGVGMGWEIKKSNKAYREYRDAKEKSDRDFAPLPAEEYVKTGDFERWSVAIEREEYQTGRVEYDLARLIENQRKGTNGLEPAEDAR